MTGRTMRHVVLAVLGWIAVAVPGVTIAQISGAQSSGGGPVVVVQTAKGAFSFETFPEEAPIAVAHIVALVRSGFYDGQRVHRALPGFVVQFGDPQSRDLAKRALWGRGAAASSGHPVGVAEFTTKHTNGKGAVGMAHMDDPAKADSQIYITLADRPDLDNRYVVFGQLISGEDVPETLQVGDEITRAYVQE
jgi:cyclophilin family peptidyl-prolyl cis-trans isomerase